MFLAPTGKAASAIGGVTQHSAFCLGIVRKDKSSEEGSSNADEISARRMQHLTTAFKDVRWLFFDEVSMTSCEIMAEIDQGLRIGKQRLDEPFGGANVIFAGDLCQLPPVSACPLYVQDTPFAHSADVRTKIALGRAAWIHIDQVVDFTHQMRMKDARMAAALSRLRLRRCISEDADLLNGNVLRSPDNPNGATLLNHPGAVVLARTNETVRILNLRKAAVQAQSTSAKLVISHAQDVSSASIGEEDRQLLLAYNGSTRTRSAVGRVPLFIGMPVVYRGPNISVPLGVTNGAFATVAGWDLGLDRWGMTTPRGVVLRFTEDAPWSLAGLEPGCLPITPIKTTFKFKASTDAEAQQVTRNQLPLQAGYAMTVHAAQGVTAQGGIVVDLRRGGFEAYVAASRATRAEDVFLIATTSIRELNHPLLPTPLQIELHRLEQIAVRSKLIHDNDTWRLVQSLKRASASEDPSPRPTQRRRTSAQLASNSR
ncbi:hypothetical protein CF326_g3895 [Tilletia indica]|nr:hypothetical protein CF326_g3895 [Tilletia indica]